MEVKSVKGKSVTLDTGLTEQFNHIRWRFVGLGSIIAESDRYEPSYRKDERFRGRLKLNHQTGSLTINNTRITDSGVYKVEINGISYKRFIVTVHVFGADEDGVKRESVMEGDSVTLDTGLREKFNLIKWRFGGSGSIIAEIDSNEISYPLNDTERFKDRLKMNNQTGSLIIKNMRITDSGDYHLLINHGYGTFNQHFGVTVNGSSVSVPALSPAAVTGIGAVVLLVIVAAAGVIYRCKSSKRGRQNPVTDKKKRKLRHQTRSLKSTDSGQSDL